MKLRIVAILDIQGNLDALLSIALRSSPLDAIIHTGNFGFWRRSTILEAADVSYLKQIVAFLETLPTEVAQELNDLSTINNPGDNSANSAFSADFKLRLLELKTPLSQIDSYIDGTKKLPCPVYTTIGSLDDPYIVSDFLTGKLSVPNLYIIDHNHSYILKLPLPRSPDVRIYGIGGNLKVHSLFDDGKLGLRDLTGKTGDLWITLRQVAELYLENTSQAAKSQDTVNLFVSHSAVMKNPLLEHLAIITGADFTISHGLHFRYPISGNGMSFVDSMGGSAGYIENYRLKFLRLRMILGELWVIIKQDVLEVLANSPPEMTRLVEFGLSLFDKIPVTIGDSTEKIVRLSLELDEEDQEDVEYSKQALKKINDLYFSAYYNLWHFDLCDYRIIDDELDDEEEEEEQFNLLTLVLNAKGQLRLENCNSTGFDFRKRENDASEGASVEANDEKLWNKAGASRNRNRGRTAKSRGRGR